MNRKIFFLILLMFQLSVSLMAITKREAQTLVDNRRYGEAIEALQTLMQQSAYAKDADCNKWLGQSLCMTGRYDESLPFLEHAVKQNKKSGAQWYLAITRQHLYDFEGALEALEAYRPVLNSSYWLSRADSLEAEIQQGIRAIDHVQDVEVLTSMWVPRSSFFKLYMLGAESGRVLNGEHGLYFENQAADYRIYAIDGALYQSHKIQNAWEEPDLLEGIGSEEYQVLTPFLRSDGETLFFASDSVPGLGGLDIYKTRYNADDDSFYQPERLGMPFNSPFDDYMMAIDETHQIGWWATDRWQNPDSVMIYVFRLEDDPDYLDEASVGRARIDTIADTWRQAGGYEAFMADVMNAEQREQKKSSLRIVISDQKVYSDPNQFVSHQAQATYEFSQRVKQQLDEVIEQLAAYRLEFSKADNRHRAQLRQQIQKLEKKEIELTEQYHKQVKEYRKLEK